MPECSAVVVGGWYVVDVAAVVVAAPALADQVVAHAG